MRKYFGTDGVRGVANKELTCDLAYKLGRAGGYVLANNEYKVKVVVGRDTRQSGDMLEAALIAGLMSVGCDVITVGVIPTPGVAYLTRKYGAECGVVISASHNPMEDNGIKFFNKDGFKLDDQIELKIEEYIKVAPMVFKELGAEVIAMNITPNGENINHECGSTHPEGLKKAVIEHKADLGLAYDGDADRLIAVDEKGHEVDGDHIMILGAVYLKKQNKLANDTLVVTTMSNIGLHAAAKEYGIDLAITDVGDRYVIEEMKKSGHNLGGEQSGHMIFLDYNTTGDGTLSSLIVSKIVKEEGKTLSEQSALMTTYPQVLINVEVRNEVKNKFMENDEIRAEIERLEKLMNGTGRVLIRPSGTQPLVRVMLEGKDEGQIRELAQGLADLIKEKLA